MLSHDKCNITEMDFKWIELLMLILALEEW